MGDGTVERGIATTRATRSGVTIRLRDGMGTNVTVTDPDLLRV